MFSKKLLISAVCAIACACFADQVNAQDVNVKIEAVIGDFDAPYAPAPEPVVRHKFIPKPGQDFGDPKSYAPDLQQITDAQWKPQMPNIMPGWGPYGNSKFYPMHGAPDWSTSHYVMESGDVIIAINDRRVRSQSDLNKAMNKSGDIVVLTVVDHKTMQIYCMGIRVKNHSLPILSSDNFLAKNNKSPLGVFVWTCLPNFEGHVYKINCPFPVD